MKIISESKYTTDNFKDNCICDVKNSVPEDIILFNNKISIINNHNFLFLHPKLFIQPLSPF